MSNKRKPSASRPSRDAAPKGVQSGGPDEDWLTWFQRNSARIRPDANVGRDDAASLVLCAFNNVEFAQDVLTLAATAWEQGNRPPPAVELYLSRCFNRILGGVDPGQALGLRKNSRRKDLIQDMELYAIVMTAVADGLGRPDAIARAAETLGISVKAASKRLERSPHVADYFDLLRDEMRKQSLLSGAKPSLGDALAGNNSMTAADRFIERMLSLVARIATTKARDQLS